MRRIIVIVVVLASFVLAGCSGSTEDRFGGDLFQSSCARCHKSDASGGIGPSLGPGSEVATEFTDEQIKNTIQVGPGAMPSFSRFTDAQLDSLVEFIRSLE
jgi:mono/diheme cytochrome c family protein